MSNLNHAVLLKARHANTLYPKGVKTEYWTFLVHDNNPNVFTKIYEIKFKMEFKKDLDNRKKADIIFVKASLRDHVVKDDLSYESNLTYEELPTFIKKRILHNLVNEELEWSLVINIKSK